MKNLYLSQLSNGIIVRSVIKQTESESRLEQKTLDSSGNRGDFLLQA